MSVKPSFFSYFSKVIDTDFMIVHPDIFNTQNNTP